MKILFDHKILVNQKKIVIKKKDRYNVVDGLRPCVRLFLRSIFMLNAFGKCCWLRCSVRSIELKLLKTFKRFKLQTKIVV